MDLYEELSETVRPEDAVCSSNILFAKNWDMRQPRVLFQLIQKNMFDQKEA